MRNLNDFVTNITLDLNCNKDTPTINSAQFDKGRKFSVAITANGESFSVAGCEATLKCVHSDKSSTSLDCTAGISQAGTTVTVTIREDTLPVRGLTAAKLVFSDGTRNYSTQIFVIDVDSSLDGNVRATEAYSIINKLIDQVHALNESGLIIIDNELNENSSNPVENRIVKAAMNTKANAADVYTKYAADEKFFTKTEASGKTDNTAFQAFKNEVENRFELHLSVGFDENGVPVKWDNKTNYSGGAFADARIVTAFVASNVTHLYSGAFAGSTNLTDIYIDKAQNAITIDSGAFPNGATVHYKGEFNAVDLIIRALRYSGAEKANKSDVYTKAQTDSAIGNAVSGKANSATTLGGYGITDAYTKVQMNYELAKKADLEDIPDITGKADKGTTLADYGITNAYTKAQADSAVCGIIDTMFSNPDNEFTGIAVELIAGETSGAPSHWWLVYYDSEGTRHKLYDISSIIPDVSGFATKQQLAAKADSTDLPTKVSDLDNDSGFLTQHQNITGKIDKSSIIRRAIEAQVGLSEDTVFSSKAVDDYLDYFLRDYYRKSADFYEDKDSWEAVTKEDIEELRTEYYTRSQVDSALSQKIPFEYILVSDLAQLMRLKDTNKLYKGYMSDTDGTFDLQGKTVAFSMWFLKRPFINDYCRYVFLRNGALYCAVGIDSDEFSIVNYNADTIDAMLGELAAQLRQTSRDLANLAEDASVQFGATLYFNNSTKKLYLQNLTGQQLGDSVHITPGLEGATLEVVKEDDINYIVLVDADGLEVSRAELPAGSGGGGGAASSTLKVFFVGANTVNVAEGQRCVTQMSVSSTIDGTETGNCTAVISTNGVVRATREIQQGIVSIDWTDFLKTGANTATVKVTDSYGASRTLRWTINSISLSISSTFDSTVAYKDTELTIKYTVMGEGDKSVHFVVDGVEKAVASAPIPNRQYTETLEALPHGGHIVEIYADATVNETVIRSNTLRYAVVCLESGNSNKVIACDFNTIQAKQGDLLAFRYIVYDPDNLNAAVTLKVNGDVVQSVTVDRTPQIWNIKNYPQGQTVFTIQSGSVSKSFTVEVEEYEPPVSMTDTGLVLDLSSVGRSNSEESPDEWSYEDISAELTGFNFNSNGWISDENGDTALRINSNAQAVIDFYPFETDCRDNGKVIELEFAIRNALADNVPLVSCLGATGVGFEVYPNKFIFSSAQTSVVAPFKDEEKIRIALVIQDKSQNRLVSTYLNGVCCGSVQYAMTDDFSQPIPVPITLGAGSSVCGIDFYNIRIYENDLNMYEILNNYIASRTKPEEIEELFQKNNIFDSYGHMIYDNVLARIPCMTYIGELPTFKGDKKTVNMIYENMQDTARSFTANGVELDVQGTSSATLPKKNFKFKIKNGCTMTATGETLSKYQLTADSIPEKNYCMKANYMDSSNCHNTEMARIIPLLMPQLPQQEVDSRIRSTILGFPCVIWHKATENSEREFIGIYDFNHDKSDTDTFGCGGQWPNAQIIEFRNNTSAACLFLSTDRDADDFEFRYPDEGNDYTNFDLFLEWGVSHDLSEWTDDTLEESYTASDGTVYDSDTQEYRIAKFRDEAPDHIDVEAMYSYWLNCDVFCMADSLVKNFFSGTSDTENDVKRPYPYDMDTVFGLNNEGVISFSPFVEMHDKVGGSFVYNGERSRFWNNIEIAYRSEIKSLYQSWRSRTTNKLSYDWLINSFYNNTISKLSAALYNLDGNYKYLSPLVEDNDASHLFCWQGDRFEYLKWWWSNRVKYKDGQYEAGDYMSNYIQMRLYTPAIEEELAVEANFDFDIQSYLPGYLRVKFGSKLRGGRQPNPNVLTHIEAPNDVFNDTECIIYGYGITDIGDLAPKYVGTVDISMGTSLTSLKIGDTTEGYVNENLKVLSLGNNALLKSLNIANCPNLTDSIDASGCTDIESIEARGSSITGVTLPVGGNLKRLNLPSTVSNLTVINHSGINEMIIEGYDNITTLRLENFPLDIKNILSRSTSLYRVRLLNVYIIDNSFALLERISTTCIGLDENNNNLPSAVITGRYHISGTIRMSDKVKYEDEFNGLTVTADTIIDDVLYDENGNVVIDKNNNVIVMPDDTTFTVSYTAAELDTWIDDVDEAIRQIEDESGDNNE